MPPFDDDSENYLFRDAQERSRRGDTGRNEPNDDSDEPDERDLAPDEMTIRCTHCRKWILEDSIRCPYCREIQLEDQQHPKPLWFIIATILCILAMLSYFIFDRFGPLSWFH